jgi:hypothetical protein
MYSGIITAACSIVVLSAGATAQLRTTPHTSAAAGVEILARDVGGITLSVDPRIELLSIVQYLAGYRPITELASAYRARVDSTFAGFRGHEAVALFRDMAASGFSFHVPPQATLHRTIDLQPALAFPESVLARGGGEDRIETFYRRLTEFRRESGFDAFFQGNRGFHERLLDDAAAHIGPLQSPELLEAYYGERMAAYTIILVPLYMPGGFGIELGAGPESRSIFSVQGPIAAAGDGLSFGDQRSFTYLVWHEFSHSFVNPLTRAHLRQVQRYEALYEPMAEAMRRQAYGNWESTVNEHIVRAVTTRLAYLHYGAEAGDRALRAEQERGFSYVAALAAALERYEAARDVYPTLNDFYPELLAALPAQPAARPER